LARQKGVTPATIFSATLRSALEHIANPAWLGEHSPLAAPYFLGGRPSGEAYLTTGRERGLLLQAAIRDAAAAMWGSPLPTTRADLSAAVDADRAARGSKSSRYRYYLLELRYLRRHFPPNAFPAAVEAMPGYVNVSPTRFFIHLDEAIEELGRRLLERLNPALRLERPGLARSPVGRSAIIAAVLAELRAGRSVAVTGAGGIGKTTAGAAVIAGWPGEVFWHTFRPGLNDDLGSLLFSLGHFTREAGAPTLWAQLLAGEGGIGAPGQALGMLRLDLEAIAARQPLLCFDEVDLLRTSTGEPRRKQHAQTLELLESLRGTAPLLLIGQRVYMDTDAHFPLEPLPTTDTGELLRQLGLKPDMTTLHRVQQFTRGNPRLLELYAALRHSGEEAGDLLRLSHAPSAQPLFSRLWRRLDESERELLAALSVFRSHAPRDAWTDKESALADLIDRGLVKSDLAGGVTLLPFHRELVYAALSAARRARSHKDAAHIRALRGDYTAAAYHYVQADEPESAVGIWFAHQDGEIMAGQTAAADEVFRLIKPDSLDGHWRTELRVIQNRLALLAGEAERVLEGMEGFKWDADDETTADALGQWGHALELRDQTEQALAKYDEAIAMLARATNKIAGWHLRRGLVYSRESDVDASRKEAQLGMYNVNRLLGMIDYLTGGYATAHSHFLEALHLAETANDKDKIARANYMLAFVAGRQGRIEDARIYAEATMAHYTDIGDRLQLEGMRAELAGMYLNVRRFEEVIEPSEKALRFFERIKHDQWISHISANLAEAYLETGRLEEAKEMVFRVLRMEVAPARPYALYTLGHVHDRQGNLAHAATSFAEGIETARANSDPFIEAYLERALGALQARDGRAADGIAHLEAALRLFTEMGLQHEVTETEAALQAARPS
jgi:tetratricopeptide (TPR) repeat protein